MGGNWGRSEGRTGMREAEVRKKRKGEAGKRAGRWMIQGEDRLDCLMTRRKSRQIESVHKLQQQRR